MTLLRRLTVERLDAMLRLVERSLFKCTRNSGSSLTVRQVPRLNFQCWKSTEAHLRVPRAKNAKKLTPLGYFLLAIPVTTFGLGTWQVQRWQWKLSLIDSLKEKTHLPPKELPENLDDLQHLEYHKVRVRGHFDHDRERYLGPRSLIVDGDTTSQGGLMSQGQTGPGYLVVTPFKPADRDEEILVNRGWVPMNKVDPRTRQGGQVTGEVELVGIVRHNETRPPFVPKNDPESSKLHYRDLSMLSQRLNTAPVFLDADVSSTIAGGPVGGQTKIALRNEHFSYVMTWYLLSAATAFMWYRQHVRGLPAI